ncbi:kinesin-like protein KIF25 [Marmota marmota marmota]|uniref:kinesin-like protein KIF25 n=1 Tax=Marmota marmota marmota TaxID=9994 RepID=UPI0020920C6B|nr:kinesin-like protein KIF25 [Marmota marmota marmota]
MGGTAAEIGTDLNLYFRLKQDVKEFRSSVLELVGSCQEQCQAHLSAAAAAVQRAQLDSQAVQGSTHREGPREPRDVRSRPPGLGRGAGLLGKAPGHGPRVCPMWRAAGLPWRSEALRLEQSLQDMEERCHREKQRRRALHNSLLELKGSIRVHCRIRPLLPFDSEWNSSASHSSSISREVAHALDDETILVKCHRPGHPKINKTYNFERVYGPAESQEAVFADVCPLLTSFLDGFNMCIMAYGQTGSGKSYTMLGPRAGDEPGLPSGAHADLGIIPRAAEELFRSSSSFGWLISESPPRSPTAELSIVEIYNNDIFDLLAKEGSGAAAGTKREVLTTREGCTEVPGLTCTAVASAAELVALVHGGLQLRARHPTLVHMASSRSHLVVTVTLTVVSPSDSTGELLLALGQFKEEERGRTSFSLVGEAWRVELQEASALTPCPAVFCPPLPPGPQHHPAPLQGHAGAGKGWSTSPQAPPLQPLPVDHTGSARQARAKLQLVDLAGSECAGASGVTGLALRETSFINRSLAALADVLGALSERRGHVPYRNSKLTHLLQDTIGGDAKLLVILCVSPGQKHVAETLQGLGFGARARQAERGQAGKRPSCAQGPVAGWLGDPHTAQAKSPGTGGQREDGSSKEPPPGAGGQQVLRWVRSCAVCAAGLQPPRRPSSACCASLDTNEATDPGALRTGSRTRQTWALPPPGFVSQRGKAPFPCL